MGIYILYFLSDEGLTLKALVVILVQLLVLPSGLTCVSDID